MTPRDVLNLWRSPADVGDLGATAQVSDVTHAHATVRPWLIKRRFRDIAAAAPWLILVKAALLATLLCSAFWLYFAGLDRFQVGTRFDDARYIILGRALAAGHGYVLNSYPDSPPELKFPPGYPLLLSFVAYWFPASLLAFKIPSLVLTVASLPLWLIVLRRRLPLLLT